MGWEGWAVGFGAPGQPFSDVTISEGDNKNAFEARDFEGGCLASFVHFTCLWECFFRHNDILQGVAFLSCICALDSIITILSLFSLYFVLFCFYES